MIYKINSVTPKMGKSGATYYELEIEGVGKASTFTKLDPGQHDGEVIKTPDGKYTNFKLAGETANFKRGPGNMEKVMDRKEASIDKFTTRKEDSIRLAGAMRDATLITLAELAGSPLVAEEFKERWNSWKSWLLDVGEQPF